MTSPPTEPAKRVVFAATDLSVASDEAIRMAHARADAMDATLVVCHIVPSLTKINMLFPQATADQASSQVSLAQQATDALIERTIEITGRGADDFVAIVDGGSPYAQIIEHAERLQAELIVVGERGMSGLTRMLLGSVAERVVRYAHGPVLVARPCAATGRVVVATDLSDPSLPVLATAAREATRSGVKVTALHCVEQVVAGMEYGIAWAPGVTTEISREARVRAVRHLADAIERFGLDADPQVLEGAPVNAILAMAESLKAELVIVGTRGKTGLSRVLLGSVAEAIVRHAGCSVLVVRLTGSPHALA